MRLAVFSLSAFVLLPSLAHAQGPVFVIKPEDSTVQFSVKASVGVLGRPTSDPHRIAHEQIACSRSRCGNSTPSTILFPLPPVNPCLTTNRSNRSFPLALSPRSLPHNHARYDRVGGPTATSSRSRTFLIGHRFDGRGLESC